MSKQLKERPAITPASPFLLRANVIKFNTDTMPYIETSIRQNPIADLWFSTGFETKPQVQATKLWQGVIGRKREKL